MFDTVPERPVVARDAWLEARRRLMVEEKALTRGRGGCCRWCPSCSSAAFLLEPEQRRMEVP